MKVRSIYIVICLVLLCGGVHSQEVVVGLDCNPVLKSLPKEKTKRIKAEQTPLQLPFFDDFSTKRVYPDENLWEDNYVYINQSFPIMPPTVGVATLDALDANGNLYSHASTVPFEADTLTSRKIRLDSVFSESLVPQKLIPADSVYFSFYYQPGGGYGGVLDEIGGTPGEQDSLILEFYRPDSTMWQTVWSTGGFELQTLFDSTGYYFDFVMISITDTVFFTADFQFRFRNICSLPDNLGMYNDEKTNCDQWHIDYVYLDKDRTWSLYDESIRDVAFVTPAESILEKYEAMPSKQFRQENLKKNFTNTIANLYKETFNMAYRYVILDANGKTVDSVQGGNANIAPFFPSFTYQDYSLHANPEIKYTFPNLKSGKNIYTIKHILTPDAYPQNDNIEFEQIFWNYYAYDDGSAENGYGIKTDNPRVAPKIAYRLDLNTLDSLSAVTIYFNYAPSNANNVPFKIAVWANGGGQPGNILYEDANFRDLNYRDTTPSAGLNKPDKFILDYPVIVNDTIYFGIVQQHSGYVNVGFDRNNDASEFIYYDAGKGWTNSYQKGALMMRPYFGKEATVGIDDIPVKERLNCKIYPNPAKDFIQIDLPEDVIENDVDVRIFDIMGKEIYNRSYEKTISVNNLRKGIYIIHILDKQTAQTFIEKIIITD